MNTNRHTKKVHEKLQEGLTLAELLIVMALLSTLLSVIVVIINPVKYFSQANNTQRLSDVNTILNAISQYAADNKGVLPTNITTTAQTIKKGEADICAVLVPKYLPYLPSDPKLNTETAITDCGSNYDTGYTVVQSTTDNHVTVAAPNAELSEIISITR